MENILDRLSKYMEVKKLNKNRITVEAGLSNGLLGGAFKNGKGLNADTVEKILYAYPDLSAEWFLRGKGKMLLKFDNLEENCMQCQEKDNKISELQAELIDRLKEIVNLQKEVKKQPAETVDGMPPTNYPTMGNPAGKPKQIVNM